MREIILSLLLIAWSLSTPNMGRATMLVHHDLKSMVRSAERIFVGRCIAVEQSALELSNGKIYYTQYTFQVASSLKGGVGGTITFRQYGLVNPIPIDGTRALYKKMLLMPNYRENHDYMLFLIGDSRLGLTSPVGLHQGAFFVIKDKRGRKVVVNGLQNRGLFKHISTNELAKLSLTRSERNLTAVQGGALPFDDFNSVVQKFVENYK